jgi:ERCC4-type nuclease
MRDRIHIVIDTREQQPWHFPNHLAVVSRGYLPVFDYALAEDSGFAIERKSLDDFVGSIASGWDVFLRRFDKVPGWPAKVVIIEGTVSQILARDYNHPDVTPKFIIKQISTLTMMGIALLFADNPITAAGLAYRILLERYQQIHGKRNDNGNSTKDDLPQT